MLFRSQVVQLGIERHTETDNPLNGMCYVIKLSNGKAVIIDGGYATEECVDTLYRALEALNIAKMSDGRYAIEAWILTHGHGDHVGTLLSMSRKYRDNIWLHYIIHNLGPTSTDEISGSVLVGDETTARKYTNETELDAILDYAWPDSARVNAHAGLKYYIGNMTLDLLYSPDVLYNGDERIGYYNDTSLIFKASAGGNDGTDKKSVFFFGDAGEVAAQRTWELYEESAFRSDILQVTHHGLYTKVGGEFAWEYIKMIYDATGAKIAFLPLNSMYPEDATGRNGRYTVFVAWSMGWVKRNEDPIDTDRCHISYFTNHNDVAYMNGVAASDVTQEHYNAFVAAVANGEYKGTFFGYDGVNKLYNENGLVTYVAANELETMYTQFSLGGGAVTLVKNQTVASL